MYKNDHFIKTQKGYSMNRGSELDLIVTESRQEMAYSPSVIFIRGDERR